MSELEARLLPSVFSAHREQLLDGWLAAQAGQAAVHAGEADLRSQSERVLDLLARAAASGDVDNLNDATWDDLRAELAAISQARARRGAKPTEAAYFVFSLKQPLFELMQRTTADSAVLAAEIVRADRLLDQLGVWVLERYLQNREEVISRQQQEVLELSTPVVKLWKGVVALPLIGTLDSERTQVVMETLLERIVETNARIAIIDITGVPAVDTRVAQHLLQTVQSARLMGADCIISGIRPPIAQTIVHLGLVLQDVVTKGSLDAAFAVALERLGLEVVVANAGV